MLAPYPDPLTILRDKGGKLGSLRGFLDLFSKAIGIDGAKDPNETKDRQGEDDEVLIFVQDLFG